jgi:hypothetical protein
MWCVGELDQEYIARMEVLGLYEKPVCRRAPVVCIDEKPVVLHAEIRSPIAMKPERAARRDYEYKPCGTANVFCGIEPKAGRHFTKVTPTRCSAEFADYLLDIAAIYVSCGRATCIAQKTGQNCYCRRLSDNRDWAKR